MSLQLPEPVDAPEEGGDPEAYHAYLEGTQDYFFKTRWLPLALTPTEYATTVDVQVGYLKELYPVIYDEGPMGPKWYGQLHAILQILDGENPQVDARDFIVDLIDTYAYAFNDTLHKRGVADNLRGLLSQDYNMAALMPDLEGSQPGDLVEAVIHHKKLDDILGMTTNYEREDFLNAMDEHAKIVLASYLLPQVRGFKSVLSVHNRFVNRYNLG